MDNLGLLNKNLDEIETDRSTWKIVVLAAIGIVFSFLFGYFLKLFLFNLNRWEFLLFSFLASLGFLVLFLLDIFYIKTPSRINLIIFLESLAFLAMFYDRLSVKFIGAAFASFLILLWGHYAGRQELENMLKIKFWRVSKKALPKAISALALFASIASVGGLNADTINENKLFISQSTFDSLVAPVAQIKFIQKLLPGFDFSMTTEEFINNLAKNQIEQSPQAKSLPKAAKNQLVLQTAKDLEKQISELVGEPINHKAKISQMLYEVLVNKFNKLPSNVKSFITMGMAALLFLAIVSLTLPIRWLATILAFLVYEICLALGFSVIMLEGRSREIILLK